MAEPSPIVLEGASNQGLNGVLLFFLLLFFAMAVRCLGFQVVDCRAEFSELPIPCSREDQESGAEGSGTR